MIEHIEMAVFFGRAPSKSPKELISAGRAWAEERDLKILDASTGITVSPKNTHMILIIDPNE